MKYMLYTLLGLFCLLIIGGVFLFVAAPVDYVEAKLIALIEEKTGRTLSVDGPVTFSIYPRIGVRLENVALSGPPTMKGEPFLQMASMTVAIPIIPLLSRQLSIDEFLLDQPVLLLRTDKQNNHSWDLTEPKQSAAAATEPGTPAAGGDAAGPLAALSGLSLGNIRVNGGTVRLIDDSQGKKNEFGNVVLHLGLANLASPLTADGSVVWNGKPLPFEMTMASPRDAIEGRGSALTLKLDTEPVSIQFAGQFQPSGKQRLSGKLQLSSPSLRNLLAFLGVAPPAVGGLGKLAITGDVAVGQTSVLFSGATIALDGWTAKGKLSSALDQPRPVLAADLSMDALDLNLYLGGAGKPAAAVPALAAAPKPAAVAVASGWSATPIDFSPLRSFDLQAKLSLGKLLFQKMKLGRTALVSIIKDGTMRTKFSEINLYKGTGQGDVSLDGRAANGKLSANFSINGVDAQSLLTDAVNLKWLAGNGSLAVAVTANGKSQRDFVQTLDGEGNVAFRNGAIIGLDIPRMARNLMAGNLAGLSSGAAAKTDFSELSASFTSANGVLSNSDLKLAGPLLRLTGKGTVDLPKQSVSYLAQPKVVASLEGQDGAADSKGIEVPVRISGPWAKPSYVPDLTALVANPGAAIETVKKLGAELKQKGGIKAVIEQLKNKDTKKALGGLLGGLLGQAKPAAPAN